MKQALLFWCTVGFTVAGIPIKYDNEEAVMVKNVCVGSPCQDLSWSKIDTTLAMSWVFSDKVSVVGDLKDTPTYDVNLSSSSVDEDAEYSYVSFDGKLIRGMRLQDTFTLDGKERTVSFGDINTYSVCNGRVAGCSDYTNKCKSSTNTSHKYSCEDEPDSAHFSYSSVLSFNQDSPFLGQNMSFMISIMDRQVLLDKKLTGGKTFHTTSSSDGLWSLPLLRVVTEEYRTGDLLDVWTCPSSCDTCRGILDTGRLGISMSPSSKSRIKETRVWDGCVGNGNDDNCEQRAISKQGLPSMLFVFGANDTISRAVNISRAYYGTYYCPTCLALAGYDTISDCDIYLGLVWLSRNDVGIEKNGDEITITVVSRTMTYNKDGSFASIFLIFLSVIMLAVLGYFMKRKYFPTPNEAQNGYYPVGQSEAEMSRALPNLAEPERNHGMVFAGSNEQGSYTSYVENMNQNPPTFATPPPARRPTSSPPASAHLPVSNVPETPTTESPENRVGGGIDTNLSIRELREQRLKALGV